MYIAAAIQANLHTARRCDKPRGRLEEEQQRKMGGQAEAIERFEAERLQIRENLHFCAASFLASLV
jgi:hypothetical protein